MLSLFLESATCQVNNQRIKNIVDNFSTSLKFLSIGYAKEPNQMLYSYKHFLDSNVRMNDMNTIDYFVDSAAYFISNIDVYSDRNYRIDYFPIYSKNKMIESVVFYSRGYDQRFDYVYNPSDTIFYDNLFEKFKFSNFTPLDLSKMRVRADTSEINYSKIVEPNLDYVLLYVNLKKAYLSHYAQDRLDLMTYMKRFKYSKEPMFSVAIDRQQLKETNFRIDGVNFNFELYTNEDISFLNDKLRMQCTVKSISKDLKFMDLYKCVVLTEDRMTDKIRKNIKKNGY